MTPLSPHAALDFEPFSRFGSYLSLRRLTDEKKPHFGPGLYLRHHHGVQFPVRELANLLVDDLVPESEWDEARLRLRAPGGTGWVDIVFEGSKALRLCGHGAVLTLRFPPIYHASMYPARGGGWEVNCRGAASKILLKALKGELETHTDWLGESSGKLEARMSAATPEGEWELALDHFHGTWTPRSFSPVAEVEAATRAEFAEWLAKIPPVNEVQEDALDDALDRARVRAAYVN